MYSADAERYVDVITSALERAHRTASREQLEAGIDKTGIEHVGTELVGQHRHAHLSQRLTLSLPDRSQPLKGWTKSIPEASKGRVKL